MATQKVVDPAETAEKHIQPGSVEMESFLAIGYPKIGSRKKAETIIKERQANPAMWPYELYEQAEAFLAALDAKPSVISKRPGWKRRR
jgi:hypothetical protein